MIVIKDFNDILKLKGKIKEPIYRYIVSYVEYIFEQLYVNKLKKSMFTLKGGYNGNGEIYIIEERNELEILLVQGIQELILKKKILWCYSLRDKEKWNIEEAVNEYFVIGVLLNKDYCSNIIINKKYLSVINYKNLKKINKYTESIK